MDQRKSHWENIYTHKSPEEVSWTQGKPVLSLSWIESLALPKDAPIIDIGGGESHLVDYLLALGYTDLSVLDISKAALQKSQARLGDMAAKVKWIEADITTFQAERTYALWHDRAVFHFLTQKRDIETYNRLVSNVVSQYILMSTFSKDGPLKCSGLPITQYDADHLEANFASDFKLLQQQKEVHTTPFNTTQAFIYALFQKAKS
ncbi:MAG: class I SAM-dependent methyltransferase [Candidatus Arcticimaribacter sp.]